tara:strand:+ start:360 stop:593 length:234 start_codon:yes stop_codon:yes gene_type:complete
MKVKHLKTKTTIELTPEEVYEWCTYVNQIDSMLDNYAEIRDVYMSDVSNLDTIRWRMTNLFNLKWDRNTHRYIKNSN